MKHWMFNCNEVSKKVSESMDRNLPLYQRMLIRMHLMMCKYCARFKKQLLALRKLSRYSELAAGSLDTALGLSSESKARIKDAMKSALS